MPWIEVVRVRAARQRKGDEPVCVLYVCVLYMCLKERRNSRMFGSRCVGRNWLCVYVCVFGFRCVGRGWAGDRRS